MQIIEYKSAIVYETKCVNWDKLNILSVVVAAAVEIYYVLLSQYRPIKIQRMLSGSLRNRSTKNRIRSLDSQLCK